ncbi:hypothetical protein A3C23_03295 [Candidatus Roizmanbacteria bacterium RIFCSPHIGHO2_02_FULL_37_13b]|uniref:Uncharacterized protein n=1 Tax=Candidatus Roizmanbacteria bacterium RIFCSPLOWO2_02_FULL_36_11 TaxID=1802071 RepID=A0A1F7JGM3_9BACT|nr:MAG: hypothetical protein A3C23_03295 [Candidatus Roizmanbacteria bacterium RIFCSPHIGHO2_02_FULL_37_13b]OGK54716.1 MAG: hypothetical protein A3H78_05485 [Candidatus Roizmanbacteria bacterium RIFCSPLOWO2_02_FULL_36_11]
MYKKFQLLHKHYQLIYSLIISTAVVGIWRGIWMLMDIFILPNDALLSAASSFSIGIIIITIAHYHLSN